MAHASHRVSSGEVTAATGALASARMSRIVAIGAQSAAVDGVVDAPAV